MVSSDFPAAHISYPLPKIYLRCVLLPTATLLPILRFQTSDFRATVRSLLLIYTYQQTVLPPHQTPIPVTYSISHLSPVWIPLSIFIITFSPSQFLFLLWDCYSKPHPYLNLLFFASCLDLSRRKWLQKNFTIILTGLTLDLWPHITVSTTWKAKHSSPISTSSHLSRWLPTPSHSS